MRLPLLVLLLNSSMTCCAALSPRDKALMDAAGEGDAKAVRDALKAGADVNCHSDEAGETPLVRGNPSSSCCVQQVAKSFHRNLFTRPSALTRAYLHLTGAYHRNRCCW